MKLKISILAALAFMSAAAFAQSKEQPKYHEWWNDVHPGKAYVSENNKKLPNIEVRGNQFYDEKGNKILFRGVSISDPDKIEHQGAWNKTLFVKLKEFGVKLVRIPVHPIAWRERTTEGYLKLLDQAVEWATEQGIYIIIDWHSIGNLKTGLFQDPMYNTTMAETFDFWRTIARHYADNNTVAFYELFNEPTLYRFQLGPCSWEEWKKVNEDLITLIRAYDKQTIPMVAGFDWAYDLTPLQYAPINATGICYVTHPYPHKRNPPYEPKWNENFGFAAADYPIVATEIGFTLDNSEANDEYGKAIVNYLEANGISWIAWVVDPEWHPNMIESWATFKPTHCGQFFIDKMKAK
jgi:aryl-phospho-beta-D-glucosidase BglC (GH1 family)